VDLRLDEVGPKIIGRHAEASKQKQSKRARRVEIAADETFDSDIPSSGNNSVPRSLEAVATFAAGKPLRLKKNLLQVDSSGLHQLSLIDSPNGSQFDLERREAEEAEMAAAFKEVERKRLELQRAAERVETAEGVDVEGTVVKKKKRRKAKAQTGRVQEVNEAEQLPEEIVVVSKRKRKKKRPVQEAAEVDG
jgi:AP-3 complex subunit delta